MHVVKYIHGLLSFLYKISWLPLVLGTVGLVYIGLPPDMKSFVNGFIPNFFKDGLLVHFSRDEIFGQIVLWSFVFVIWGNSGTSVKTFLSDRKNKKLIREINFLKQYNDDILLDYFEIFSIFIKGYYAKIKMGSNERVSLYKADKDNFICIGRYSNDEFYRRKPDKIYPMYKGCIGRAWRQNKFDDANFPDPEADLDAYCEYQHQVYQYDRDIVQRIRMKSRSFYGLRLKAPDQTAIAVLIFESTEPDGLKFGKIERLLDLEEQRKLGALVNALESHIPSLHAAEEEGF